MNGGQDGPDRQWTEERRRAWTELTDVFGPVRGMDRDPELMGLTDDPPWQAVMSTEAAGLLSAYVRLGLKPMN